MWSVQDYILREGHKYNRGGLRLHYRSSFFIKKPRRENAQNIACFWRSGAEKVHFKNRQADRAFSCYITYNIRCGDKM